MLEKRKSPPDFWEITLSCGTHTQQREGEVWLRVQRSFWSSYPVPGPWKCAIACVVAKRLLHTAVFGACGRVSVLRVLVCVSEVDEGIISFSLLSNIVITQLGFMSHNTADRQAHGATSFT